MAPVCSKSRTPPGHQRFIQSGHLTGSRCFSSNAARNHFFSRLTKPWTEQTPQRLPLIEGAGEDFWASSWSADGRKVAGTWVYNRLNYLYTYDCETRTYENFNLVGFRPVWMSDNRHLLYERDGRVHILETQTKKSHEIFSADPHTIIALSPTHDARMLYYTLQKTESDVWLLSRE